MTANPAFVASGNISLSILFLIPNSTDIGFEVAKGKGLIFGLEFRLDADLTGSLKNGLIVGPTIEVDETTAPTGGSPPFTIGSRATYVGTIA